MPRIVSNISCRVRVLNRHQSIVIGSAYLTKSLTNISVNLEVSRKQNSGNFVPFLINVTIDACKLLAGKSTTIYAKYMLDWIQLNSNINHECPYEGYVFVVLPSVTDYIPVFIPPGDYRLDLNFYINNQALVKVEGYGTIAMILRRKEEEL